MAGRGRGRGRGMSFSVETLGFGRGEALPGPLIQPPPLFPPLEFKPVPLATGEEYDYLLALKQEYRGTLKESAYFIKPPEKRKYIERYSDKYLLGQQDNGDAWTPDWSRLPSELRVRGKRRPKVKTVIKPKVVPNTSRVKAKEEEIIKTLNELEEKEGKEEGDDEEKEEKAPGEEELEEEEEYYEEDELEEETDYNMTYFDNGEGFGYDEEDDVDEGATY